MADDDIYKTKGKYEHFKANINSLLNKPEATDKRRKYYCRNPVNLKYFDRLFGRFEAKDLSFVRRYRVLRSFSMIIYCVDKDLSEVNRDDVDKIISFMHTVYKSPKSKSDFIRDIKYLWKIILPENDEKGRPDESIVPYAVRHLSGKIDISKDKMRNDRIDFDEFQKLMDYFSSDARMQLYLSLGVESLSRPQEILYRKIKDIKLNDDYAVINISDHGKEGTGIMQCIDSYPNLIKWLEQHPLKNNPEAYIFVNRGNKNLGKQMTPLNVNQQLRTACKVLGINKNITCYSLKRNGVTFRRLRGDADLDIQHAARWTSTKQLKTYDMSTQEDALTIQLIKKGIIKANKPELKRYQPENKKCSFCEELNPFSNKFCEKCKHPLDRASIFAEDKKKEEEVNVLKAELDSLKSSLEERKPYEEIIAKLLQKKEIQELIKKELMQ